MVMFALRRMDREDVACLLPQVTRGILTLGTGPPPLKALDRTPYGIFHPMISVRVFVIGRPERPTA